MGWLIPFFAAVVNGSLVAKTHRAYMLFRGAERFKRTQSGVEVALKLTASIIFLELVLATIWFTGDPMAARTSFKTFSNGEVHEHETCESEDGCGYMIMCIYHFMLIVAGGVLSCVSRNYDQDIVNPRALVFVFYHGVMLGFIVLLIVHSD